MEQNSIINGTKTSTKWYEEFPKAEKPCKHTKTDFEVLNLKEKAKKYLEAEASTFQLKQSQSRNSELKWLRTALQRGTTSDKVAASIVLIQINPKCNLTQISFLLSLVKSAKHNQCDLVIDAVKDLFLSDLLHPKFKLLKFEEQDLDKIDNPQNSDHQINKVNRNQEKWLAYIYFEDQLRCHFETFISLLSNLASDSVEINRVKVINVMTHLLIKNSEQEHKILQLIVNKIGDPYSKVASKAVFCLLKLLYEHPNMKTVVMREIEKLLFRRNVPKRAQYYSICLLTQFVLTKADEELATSLIEVYFAFFKACLKKEEPNSKIMAAILKGVSRTYNYAKCDSELLYDNINALYKIVHIGSFNVSLNALNLLYHVEIKNVNKQDRYYTAFYKKLLDPQIGVASKRAIFLNLLHRVLQNDQSLLRRHAFIKRTLQTTLYYPSNMVCGILYVISKVLQSKKDLMGFFSSTQRITKDDKSNEKETDSSNNRQIISSSQQNGSKIQLEIDPSIMINVTTNPTENLPKQNVEIKEMVEDISQKPYDPFCRNPLHSNAYFSMYSELILLCDHFHPSVSLFANNIVDGKPIDYTGDPLEDLTLIRFLDRYVFKNPKKLGNKKLQNKNDPLAQRANYVPKGIRSLPVDSMAYLNENEKYIPVDELFLYRYLKIKKGSTDDMIDNDKDSDNDSVNSEEFNELLSKLGTDKDMDDLDIAANIGMIKNKDDEEDESDQMEDEEEDNAFDADDDYPSDTSISTDRKGHNAVKQQKLKHRKNKDQFDTNMSTDNDYGDSDLSDISFGGDTSDDDDDDVDDVNDDDDDDDDYSHRFSKANSKENLSNLYVSADKFAQMLEENSRTKTKHGGTDALNTMDGASSKQLDWEIKRNQKLTGSYNKNKRKSMKRPFNKNKKMKR